MTENRGRDAVSWDSAAHTPELQALLGAAAAPTHEDELAGLTAAVTAFSLAKPPPRRNPMMSVLAKLIAVKALVATIGAATVGGVALAAATGTLPAPIQTVAHNTVGAPSAVSSEEEVDATETPEQADATPTKTATPSPNLVGLCRAYGAGVATSHGKALENPAFTVLITTAGGKDLITGFCTTLLATAPGGRPTSRPTHAPSTHKPTAHPTHAASTHKPTTHPTGKPAGH